LSHIGTRYTAWSSWLKNRWGVPVRKIPLDTGSGCPNRKGLFEGGCIFCDQKGGGTGAFLSGESLESQVNKGLERIRRSNPAGMAILYLQSYSSTNTAADQFRKLAGEILCLSEVQGKVAGIAVGARPDQLPDEILDFLESLSIERGIDVWLEIGVQTMDGEGLKWLGRGHGKEEIIDSFSRSAGRNIFTCAHLISGIPGEKEGQLAESSLALAMIGVDAVKFHPLYVLKGTRLETLYRAGDFEPLLIGDYVREVVKAIRVLPGKTIIQRISADASPPELVAPSWITEKSRVIALVNRELEKLGARQGDLFTPGDGSQCMPEAVGPAEGPVSRNRKKNP